MSTGGRDIRAWKERDGVEAGARESPDDDFTTGHVTMDVLMWCTPLERRTSEEKRVTDKVLAGWGNYPKARCEVLSPEREADVKSSLTALGTALRGLGRSYGDQATNDGGRVLEMTRLDRYLSFNEAKGILCCEAGVSLEQLLRDFAPKGWFPMITPGTKFVTIGGCIANDIHGKAHHVDGTFANCVESFTILCADGEVRHASRDKNSELFWANFGGLGLLGVILTATIKLRRVETTYFVQRAVNVSCLDELLEAFEHYDKEFPYSVAWVDPRAVGSRLGCGVLTLGAHATPGDLSPGQAASPLVVTNPSPVKVPFEMPNMSLNPLTLRILNVLIHQVQARGAAIAHYEKFFYPLDFVGEWNRGYGSRGFTQYQFVVPLAGAAQMRRILETIANSRFLPFLNVLKKFGVAQKDAVLSFPFEGYTFAIDFPIERGLGDFLARLDEMVHEVGGRIYLGKDAFLSEGMFKKMYPRHVEWLEVKHQYDPEGLFTSDIGRRVGLV